MFVIKYKTKNSENFIYMPSYIYENESDAKKMCNKFNSISDFFIHEYEFINKN